MQTQLSESSKNSYNAAASDSSFYQDDPQKANDFASIFEHFASSELSEEEKLELDSNELLGLFFSFEKILDLPLEQIKALSAALKNLSASELKNINSLEKLLVFAEANDLNLSKLIVEKIDTKIVPNGKVELIKTTHLINDKTKKTHSQTQSVSVLRELVQAAKEQKSELEDELLSTNAQGKTLLLEPESKSPHLANAKQEHTEATLALNEIAQFESGLSDAQMQDGDEAHTVKLETTTQPQAKEQTSAQRESVRNLAQDLAERLKDYKPPISKISLEITPEKLGKIDVELVSKGNSLYVNFGSNNQALSLIMNNLNEFKNALSELGFEDVQMGFDSGQGEGHEDKEYKTLEEYQKELLEDEMQDDLAGMSLYIPLYF